MYLHLTSELDGGQLNASAFWTVLTIDIFCTAFIDISEMFLTCIYWFESSLNALQFYSDVERVCLI